jgi:6-phosphogluconolactonase
MTTETETIVLPDSESMALRAREWLVERCREAIESRGQCIVALSGGSTPKRLYELLAELPTSSIDWSKIVLLWGDERDVGEDHPDSNFRMVRLALLDRLQGVSPKFFPIPCGKMTASQAADEYEKTLRQLAVDGNLKIDVVFLGLGDDAHTASLFPETSALTVKDRWVVANEVPKLKTTRITLTEPIINQAHHVAFLVCSANKRWALDKIQGSERDPNLYPSQLIRPSGKLWWFLDQAAANR